MAEKVTSFPRIGFVYDGDVSTPHIPASVNFTDQAGVQVSLPFTEAFGQHYARWFDTDGPCRASFTSKTMNSTCT